MSNKKLTELINEYKYSKPNIKNLKNSTNNNPKIEHSFLSFNLPKNYSNRNIDILYKSPFSLKSLFKTTELKKDILKMNKNFGAQTEQKNINLLKQPNEFLLNKNKENEKEKKSTRNRPILNLDYNNVNFNKDEYFQTNPNLVIEKNLINSSNLFKNKNNFNYFEKKNKNHKCLVEEKYSNPHFNLIKKYFENIHLKTLNEYNNYIKQMKEIKQKKLNDWKNDIKNNNNKY